jgi:hypothetical protein
MHSMLENSPSKDDHACKFFENTALMNDEHMEFFLFRIDHSIAHKNEDMEGMSCSIVTVCALHAHT